MKPYGARTERPGNDARAVRLAQRYGVHPYDAAILAAAQELGAGTVYSEDLSHDQTCDGVRVVNPFQGLAATLSS